MKLATETITVFHYAFDPESGYDAWTPTVFQDVSFHGDTATTVITDTGLAAASKYVIRVPTADEINVKAGDIIVKGETGATNPTELDGAITVVGVTDNRDRPHGKHWKIVGK